MEITAPPTIDYSPDVSKVILADGTRYPVAFVARIELDGGAYRARLSMVADSQGRASCRELRVASRQGGDALTAVALRGLRLGELIKAAVGAAFERVSPDGAWVPLSEADIESATRPRVAPADREREVARVYNRAAAANQPPLQAVMRELYLARATASRAIRAAKEHGYITTTQEQDR